LRWTESAVPHPNGCSVDSDDRVISGRDRSTGSPCFVRSSLTCSVMQSDNAGLCSLSAAGWRHWRCSAGGNGAGQDGGESDLEVGKAVPDLSDRFLGLLPAHGPVGEPDAGLQVVCCDDELLGRIEVLTVQGVDESVVYVGGPELRDGGRPLARGELRRGDTYGGSGSSGTACRLTSAVEWWSAGLRAAGAPRTGSRCPGWPPRSHPCAPRRSRGRWQAPARRHCLCPVSAPPPRGRRRRRRAADPRRVFRRRSRPPPATPCRPRQRQLPRPSPRRGGARSRLAAGC